MIENAFSSNDGRYSHLSEYICESRIGILRSNGRCLLFFILPDECLFLRNKRDNNGFVMENDEIRLKRRRAMEDPSAFRSTGTSS